MLSAAAKALSQQVRGHVAKNVTGGSCADSTPFLPAIFLEGWVGWFGIESQNIIELR